MGKSVLLKRREALASGPTPIRDDGSDSTEPVEISMKAIKQIAWVRRGGTLLLFVFVIAGALSVFGVNEDRVTAAGGGYELSVEYSSVTRPGLETPWVVLVQRPDGFNGPLELRTTSTYFEMFDFNRFYPEPDSMQRDGPWTILEFPEPVGDRFELSLDAKLSPATQKGETAETAVLENGAPVAAVKYRTRVMP